MNTQSRQMHDDDLPKETANPWLWALQAVVIIAAIPALLLLTVVAIVALG